MFQKKYGEALARFEWLERHYRRNGFEIVGIRHHSKTGKLIPTIRKIMH